jgi:hypothetical protein
LSECGALVSSPEDRVARFRSDRAVLANGGVVTVAGSYQDVCDSIERLVEDAGDGTDAINASETDCMAGHMRLEPPNPSASYLIGIA